MLKSVESQPVQGLSILFFGLFAFANTGQSPAKKGVEETKTETSVKAACLLRATESQRRGSEGGDKVGFAQARAHERERSATSNSLNIRDIFNAASHRRFDVDEYRSHGGELALSWPCSGIAIMMADPTAASSRTSQARSRRCTSASRRSAR